MQQTALSAKSNNVVPRTHADAVPRPRPTSIALGVKNMLV